MTLTALGSALPALRLNAGSQKEDVYDWEYRQCPELISTT